MQKQLSHGGNGDITLGIDDQGLLAELLCFGEVVPPLEKGKSLVDEREDVDEEGLVGLLHLNGGVELLDGFLVLLLVEQKLTVVVVDVWDLWEILHAAAESSHGGGNAAHLVLCDTQLDVGEDEILVKVDGLLVVLSSLAELGLDEVQLCTVVVDVRVVLVLFEGGLEISLSGSRVSCKSYC